MGHVGTMAALHCDMCERFRFMNNRALNYDIASTNDGDAQSHMFLHARGLVFCLPLDISLCSESFGSVLLTFPWCLATYSVQHICGHHGIQRHVLNSGTVKCSLSFFILFWRNRAQIPVFSFMQRRDPP